MVGKCHNVTFRPEICVKMFIFKVDVQSDHLHCRDQMFMGQSVTGEKCHHGRFKWV
jgi:hypothetical protein